MTEQVLGFLGLMRRAGALAVGAEDAFDAARENKARVLLMAGDVAKNTVSAMHNAAAQKEAGIPLVKLDCTKRELGSALGVRECAALAVLDTGFALALCKKLEQTELIADLEARLEREKKRKAKKEARKEAKKEPQAPVGVRNSGAVRRIAEKKGRPGQGKPGFQKAKGPAEGRKKTQRENKPRVTGKRGN